MGRSASRNVTAGNPPTPAFRPPPADVKRSLIVPDELNRNDPTVVALGPEHTGSRLIRLVIERLGLRDLSATDVLDVGCGVRFAQAILACDIAIHSYTGIDVHRPLIDWLKNAVADPRFSFAHWDVHNAMYHPTGAALSPEASLPVRGAFDVIWLFSVFTHLDPADASAMLGILRRHVRPAGHLFFSVRLEEAVETFEDATPERPLENACYNPRYLQKLVESNGWRILSVNPRNYAEYIMDYVICSPATSA